MVANIVRDAFTHLRRDEHAPRNRYYVLHLELCDICISWLITVEHVRQMLGLEHLEISCQNYVLALHSDIPHHNQPSTPCHPHDQYEKRIPLTGPTQTEEPSAIDRGNAVAFGITHIHTLLQLSTPLQRPPVLLCQVEVVVEAQHTSPAFWYSHVGNEQQSRQVSQ